MSKSKIAIYYEHPDWFRPLFAELDRRGIEYERLNAARHFFEPGGEASARYSLFFNRMSTSANLRGHGNAVFYTRGVLADLERQGLRVINGHDAFEIEISKALQLSLFARLGLRHPRTRVVSSVGAIPAASDGLAFPVVIKPNIGGRGAGIVKFDSEDKLLGAIGTGLIDLGLDCTALVQEFVAKRGRHINRVETLGGKFLYAIKVYPEGENFNLCPAEICQVERAVSTAGELCIADAVKTGLRIEAFEPPAEIIKAVERIAREAKLDVGGVEYLIDDRTGEALFYDINALSNFVADTSLIGFDPHERLVDFILEELERCDTDTGCRFSAAG